MTGLIAIKELNIVLVGRFNPAIFHPQWLAKKGIITDAAADSVAIKVNHPEISDFSFDYCNYQILLNRFSASSNKEEQFIKITDEVKNIFKFLPETPIHQLGINWTSHYKFSELTEYKEFGHKHVPKKLLWNDVLKNPGLNSLVVQGERDDDYQGKIVVTTKVSQYAKIKEEYKKAIQITALDHYDLFDVAQKEADASKAIEILENNFENSQKQSNDIIEKVFNYGGLNAK